MVDLNLKDAPIRLRIPLEEVSDTPVNPADPAIEKIRKALTKQSEAGTMEALSSPPRSAITSTTSPSAKPRSPSQQRYPPPITKTFPTPPPTPAPPPTSKPCAKPPPNATTLSLPSSYQIESAIQLKRKLVLGYASQIDDETGTLIS